MPKKETYRFAVLELLNERGEWMTGIDIALLVGLQYKPTIDVLNALMNEEMILREGRKFTARYGSLSLAKPASQDGALRELESIFHVFFKR